LIVVEFFFPVDFPLD